MILVELGVILLGSFAIALGVVAVLTRWADRRPPEEEYEEWVLQRDDDAAP